MITIIAYSLRNTQALAAQAGFWVADKNSGIGRCILR